MAKYRWTTHRKQHDPVRTTIKFEFLIVSPFICFPPVFLPVLVSVSRFIFFRKLSRRGPYFLQQNTYLLCEFKIEAIFNNSRNASSRYAPTSNSCIFTPNENWTHIYMKLITRNSPYYHPLKYLLFLLKHSVYCSMGLPRELTLSDPT
jgi:hypothetical protein